MSAGGTCHHLRQPGDEEHRIPVQSPRMPRDSHREKRETALARWLPAGLYAANAGGWAITAAAIGHWQLLPLALLTLPALALYLWRTRAS